jgi:hypothetical protein
VVFILIIALFTDLTSDWVIRSLLPIASILAIGGRV